VGEERRGIAKWQIVFIQGERGERGRERVYSLKISANV
jgi:hypothetical protein